MRKRQYDSSEDEDEEPSRPMLGAATRNKPPPPPPQGRPSQPARQSVSVKVGGVGKMLLQKMGWKSGEGLGRSQQGISEPITVKLRPMQVGLGYRGSDRNNEPPRANSQLTTVAGPSDEFTDQLRKAAAPTRDGWIQGKGRASHRTANEIIQSELAYTRPSIAEKVGKIYDMRGPDIKETMADSLTIDDSPVEYATSKYLPELLYNLQEIVKCTITDLQSFSRNLAHEADKLEHTNSNLAKLTHSTATMTMQVQRLEEIASHIITFSETVKSPSSNENAPAIVELFLTFMDLMVNSYKDDVQRDALGPLIASIVIPSVSACAHIRV